MKAVAIVSGGIACTDETGERRAIPVGYADQDRKQGQRLSGVVAGSERAAASGALDRGRARPLSPPRAALVYGGDLKTRSISVEARDEDSSSVTPR
jgi:hypothetical protein